MKYCPKDVDFHMQLKIIEPFSNAYARIFDIICVFEDLLQNMTFLGPKQGEIGGWQGGVSQISSLTCEYLSKMY